MEKVEKYRAANVVNAGLLEFQLNADFTNYVYLLCAMHNQGEKLNFLTTLSAKFVYLKHGGTCFKITLASLCSLIGG